jgi:hypothetical protein
MVASSQLYSYANTNIGIHQLIYDASIPRCLLLLTVVDAPLTGSSDVVVCSARTELTLANAYLELI